MLDHIEKRSAQDTLSPAVWMTNRVIEYHDDDTLSDSLLSDAV